MEYESCTITNVGKRRTNNEDNYFCNGTYKKIVDINNEKYCESSVSDNNLYAVCDGMGGEEFGEKASLIAVSILSKYKGKDIRSYINEYITEANDEICELIRSNGGVRSGSTVAILGIDKGKATAYNIGDSRVYLLRNGELMQMSQDHTKVEQLCRMGAITKEEARSHKDRHIITQHLGLFPEEIELSPYISEETAVEPGDKFLLCSDGLTDMLTDDDIKIILSEDHSSEEIARKLVDLALESGGKDNVTVQVITCRDKTTAFGIKGNRSIISRLTMLIIALLILGLCAFLTYNFVIKDSKEDLGNKRQNNTGYILEHSLPVIDEEQQDG